MSEASVEPAGAETATASRARGRGDPPSGVVIFPEILGAYRLDAENTAVLMAKEVGKRFPTVPEYAEYEQAVVKLWSDGVEAPEGRGHTPDDRT